MPNPAPQNPTVKRTAESWSLGFIPNLSLYETAPNRAISDNKNPGWPWGLRGYRANPGEEILASVNASRSLINATLVTLINKEKPFNVPNTSTPT